jgi:hypothetical protein
LIDALARGEASGAQDGRHHGRSVQIPADLIFYRLRTAAKREAAGGQSIAVNFDGRFGDIDCAFDCV